MGVSEDTMMRPTRDNRVPTTTAGRNQPAKTLRGHWRHLWVVWVGLVSTTGLSPGEIYTAARPAGSPSGVGWVGGVQGLPGGGHKRMAPRQHSWQLWATLDLSPC